MDSSLRDDMDETIADGKAQTEETRADVHARAEEARADLDAQAQAAEGQVREHFEQVRGEAADELRTAADAANRAGDDAHAGGEPLGSSVEREREAAEDRLVEMLDTARERQASHEGAGERIAHEAKGLFDKIKNKVSGDHH